MKQINYSKNVNHLLKRLFVHWLRWLFVFGNLFGMYVLSHAQNVPINARLMKGSWNAQWISCPGVSARSYGVYHFRKAISLQITPSHFILHVSADNRFRLYVNGTSVGRGPARSSLYKWNFDSFDIASYLHQGKNVIAALVWNMGEYAPVAQISNQTGFLLQATLKKKRLPTQITHGKCYAITLTLPVH
ncbi:MAG: hypothetical protein M3Z26_06795 [Bacteroidota bacterium]|nr:hypothetical protein [Bacteroidota bacterium]